MLKKLEENALNFADHAGMATNWHFARLDPKHSFEDIFKSSFWDHYKARFHLNDVIRVRAEDGSFDVMVTVAGRADNGDIEIELWPKFPAHLAAEKIASVSSANVTAESVKPSKVPLSPVDGKPTVRVEFLEVTKWRLLGWDGREVSRDHATQTKAREAMAKYLNYHKLEMPSDEEVESAVAEIAKDRADRLAADKVKHGGKTKVA